MTSDRESSFQWGTHHNEVYLFYDNIGISTWVLLIIDKMIEYCQNYHFSDTNDIIHALFM